MSEYAATVFWERGDQDFCGNAYSRGHSWSFDGGLVVPASASPDIVPLPWSVAENVDPEEAFVASISSCHMLFFLSLAAKRKIMIDRYKDAATGFMQQREDGKIAMTKVILRPEATYGENSRPSREQLEKLHHRAHELCFIANSVNTTIVTEIVA